MMHNRRNDLDHSRRDPRERDSSPAGISRKRPSMLSEFQGKHVYSDRERARTYGSHDYYGSHGSSHRKGHVTSGQGGGGGNKYGGPSGGGHHRPSYNDPRHHSYRHFTSRPNVDASFSSDLEPQQYFAKRPKLHDSARQDKTLDTGKSFMNNNITVASVGNSTVASSSGVEPIMEDVSPADYGLRQYLSDIESEDDVDVVTQMDNEQQQQQQKVPMLQQEQAPQQLQQSAPASTGQPLEERGIKKLMEDVEEKDKSPVVCRMTKEELLLLMERVDHDIAKVELQVSVLKKKEAELADAEIRLSQAPLQPSPSTDKPPDVDKEEKVVLPMEPSRSTPSPRPLASPVQPSLMEMILADNQRRVKNAAETLLTSFSCAAWMTKRLQQPLYWQPSESPGYFERIERHKQLRPQLAQIIRRRKLELHRREVKLCERYDSLLSEWEKKVEKIEGNAKRKAKDLRNKEFFEKHFPEIKRHTLRLGPKGFSVVRSEAELNEILDELYEQEEALDRYQRAHAPIPPMILNPKGEHQFVSTNGLVRDALLAHKEQRLSGAWTDEEKQTFSEKFATYPKCFERIAQFIPNKTTSDCVQFYYLSKKKEKYKEGVAKVKEQKRKASLLARQQLAESASPGSSGSYICSQLHKLSDDSKSKGKLRLLNETQGRIYTGWTADEIQRLREGLRLYGRAWGKIYRMVGPVKTATQCKSFFDDYRDDSNLQLHKALSEHNIIKNAQKAKRKAEARKQSASSAYEAEKKRRQLKEVIIHESSDDATDDIESDRDSIIESSVISEEKTFSEVTTEADTLSSRTDSESSTEEADEVIVHQANHSLQRTRPSRLPSVRTSEENIDLLFSAAEALASVDSSNGILGISTKLALHDHTYSKPTESLTADFQRSSGLSLIAAAAAVVSPTLSSSPTGKSPLLSPVKAPRGRPPSSQKRSGALGNKLGPTFLSPAGPSMHISLTDNKSLRGRGRGATIPITKTIPHGSKNSSITTKLTIPANRVGKASVMSPTTGASKFPPFSTGSNKSSSIPHAMSQQGSTLAAFEALVNVAAAAKPAELHPKGSSYPAVVSCAQPPKRELNPITTDLVSVISSAAITMTTSIHQSNPGVSLPLQSILRFPPHSAQPKQTTVVMAANKPRSIPLPSHKPSPTLHGQVEMQRSLFPTSHKLPTSKNELPSRTLTAYAPLMAAAQQSQSASSPVSSSSLVVKRSVVSSPLQHSIFISTPTRTISDVAAVAADCKLVSSQAAIKPVGKAVVSTKTAVKSDAPVKASETALPTQDDKRDHTAGRLSESVPPRGIVSSIKSGFTDVNEGQPIPVSPCLEVEEEKELLSAPLRIMLDNSSSKLVPLSISQPPEGEVLILSSKTPSDELASKMSVAATKTAKKGQRLIKFERDKSKVSKKSRNSDECESKKDQSDSTIVSVDDPTNSDILSALIPSLANSTSTSMFLNPLTSTTGPLPSRGNITHIIDRSHSNSPATDLINTSAVDNEDHLVSAAHDISELSKLLEPISSSDQPNLDERHHDKIQPVASGSADYFCPDATALSLFSYIPDSGSGNGTSEQQNSTTVTASSS